MVLGGLLAGGAALDGVTRTAIIPGILGPSNLRSGLALNYGLYQVTGIVGPAIGGLLIAGFGLATTYGLMPSAVSAPLTAAFAIGSQRPVAVSEHPPVRRAIAEGLRYVVANRALSGSFAIDLVAMTFGMPRALFAVLSLTVYHAGATGTGFLYSAVAVGGTLAVLSSGWVAHASRLGRIVIFAVLVWGAAIAAAALVSTLGPAIVPARDRGLGRRDQRRLPLDDQPDGDHRRAARADELRLTSWSSTSGPRLGDIESGLVAGLTSALTSMFLGGLACIVGVGAVVLAFPELAAFDVDKAMAPSATVASDTVRVEK